MLALLIWLKLCLSSRPLAGTTASSAISCCIKVQNGLMVCYQPTQFDLEYWPLNEPQRCTIGDSSLVRRAICPKGHLSETYRHRVRDRARVMVWVRVRFTVKFRNPHNSTLDKWPFRQLTCNLHNLRIAHFQPTWRQIIEPGHAGLYQILAIHCDSAKCLLTAH